MSERLARLTPAQCDLPQAQLYDAIAGGPRAKTPQLFALAAADGSLNGPFGLMLHAPALGLPLQELGAAVRFRTELSDRAREIAILVVAVATNSDFEWYAHERVGAAVGLTPAELAALQDGSFARTPTVLPEEAAFYDVAYRLARDEGLSDTAYAAARKALGELALVEIVVLVGYYRTLAQMMSLFAVGRPAEQSEAAQ